MDTTALRWFQQVADGTTVTELADIELVSQPGVSRALARLETEVGTPLLRRSGRTLKMTRAGATFKRHVDKLLHDLDDGLAALSELTDPQSGTVAVAFQQSLGTWLVPELVATFRATYPDVRFALYSQRDELEAPALADGVADVEITTLRAPGTTIKWRALRAEPLHLAVPAGHRLAGRRTVSLADAAAEPFVMLRRTYALRGLSQRLCRAAGFDPVVAFEGDDLPTVAGFVAAGLGVAIVPAPQGTVPAGLRVPQLTDDGAVREIGLAWSTERRLPPSAEAFRRHVREYMARRD